MKHLVGHLGKMNTKKWKVTSGGLITVSGGYTFLKDRPIGLNVGLKFGVGGTASLVKYKRTNEGSGSDPDGDYTIIVNLKKRDVIIVDLLPYI